MTSKKSLKDIIDDCLLSEVKALLTSNSESKKAFSEKEIKKFIEANSDDISEAADTLFKDYRKKDKLDNIRTGLDPEKYREYLNKFITFSETS
jgi:hypothetical protein